MPEGSTWFGPGTGGGLYRGEWVRARGFAISFRDSAFCDESLCGPGQRGVCPGSDRSPGGNAERDRERGTLPSRSRSAFPLLLPPCGRLGDGNGHLVNDWSRGTCPGGLGLERIYPGAADARNSITGAVSTTEILRPQDCFKSGQVRIVDKGQQWPIAILHLGSRGAGGWSRPCQRRCSSRLWDLGARHARLCLVQTQNAGVPQSAVLAEGPGTGFANIPSMPSLQQRAPVSVPGRRVHAIMSGYSLRISVSRRSHARACSTIVGRSA